MYHAKKFTARPAQIALNLDALATRYQKIQQRIEAACQRAGRSPEEVTLVAVSKTFPLAAIEQAQAVGLQHFGENKVQELTEKTAALPGQHGGGPVVWHMIGHLQRNKAKDVAAQADVFHALDSERLARTLNQRVAEGDRILPCLVQVNVSGEASKYGLDPDAALAFLGKMGAYPHLQVRGLMTLAAPTPDPEAVRPQFQRLRSLRDAYAGTVANVQLEWLSMGMSGDFEVAIEEGATHVRIGSALFGPRG